MRNRKPTRAAIFGAAAAAWIGVLFFFSGQDASDSGSLSLWVVQSLFGWLIRRGADAALLEYFLRKAAHFGIFMVEGFFFGMALMSLMKKRFVFPIVLCGSAVIAILNELHQRTSIGRTCQVSDMVIDFSGAALGLLIAAAITWLLDRRYNKHTERITTGDLT